MTLAWLRVTLNQALSVDVFSHSPAPSIGMRIFMASALSTPVGRTSTDVRILGQGRRGREPQRRDRPLTRKWASRGQYVEPDFGARQAVVHPVGRIGGRRRARGVTNAF
jgi:hypothetical protein